MDLEIKFIKFLIHLCLLNLNNGDLINKYGKIFKPTNNLKIIFLKNNLIEKFKNLKR